MQELKKNAREVVATFVWRSEKIQWIGTPNIFRVFGTMRLPIIAGLSLIILGTLHLLGVPLTGVHSEEIQKATQIWAIVSICMGVALLGLFGIGTYVETTNTFYVITDKRFLWINTFTKKENLAVAAGQVEGLTLIDGDRIGIDVPHWRDAEHPTIIVDYLEEPSKVAELLSDTLNLKLKTATEIKSPRISVSSIYAAILSTFYEMVPHRPANPFAEILLLLLTWCGYLAILAFFTLSLPTSPIRHACSFAAFFVVTHGLLERWLQVRQQAGSND